MYGIFIFIIYLYYLSCLLLLFHFKWFNLHPWLHYVESNDSGFCHVAVLVLLSRRMYLGIVPIRLYYLCDWKDAIMTFNMFLIDKRIFFFQFINIDHYFVRPHPHPGMTTQNYYLATACSRLFFYFQTGMERTLAYAGTQVTNPSQSHVGKNEQGS